MTELIEPDDCEIRHDGEPCGKETVATLVDDRKNGLGRMAVCNEHRKLWADREYFDFE